MPAETDEHSSRRRIGSALRGTVGSRAVPMLLLGVLTGYSISVLGEDAVVLPVAGSVSGQLVGAAGLLVAAGAYYRVGSCDCCGGTSLGLTSSCGCDADCGDSCSVDH